MRLFIILCCSLTALILSAQDTLHIRVVTGEQKEPVLGASVRAGNESGITDRKGEVSFINTSLADSIIITAVSYKKIALPMVAGQHFYMIELQPGASSLDNVVVSGTLRPVSKLSSPVVVEVYNRQFLKRNPTPNVFEAVSAMNGVQPTIGCNVCNTGDIRINGMEGPYTMVLIDGMPIVSSLSTVYGLMGIPNSIIQRIEVIKGPASTLYGSEAVGGLINIITRGALNAPAFSADVNTSTLKETNIDLSGKWMGNKSSGLLSLNAFQYWHPHDINQDYFTDVTQQRRLSLFGKWDWENRRGRNGSVAMRLFAENRWGGQLDWHKGLRGSNKVYGESIITERAELIGNMELNAKLLLQYSYNYHQQDSWYGTTTFLARQHTFFSQLRWQHQWRKHHLLAGIPFRLLRYDDNTTATSHVNGANKPSNQITSGLFLQDEWNWTKQLTLLTGLRMEHNNLQGAVASPRLAIKYQPDDHHTLRVSAGNGFRVVNLFTEDHAAISGFREIIIKNDLKPERSWNINTNYSGDAHLPTGILSWDVNLFYTRFSNKIIPDYLTDPAKIIYDNLDGFAVSKGIALNIDWTSNSGVKAYTGMTLMDVFTESPVYGKQTQLYAPKWSGIYGLTVPVRSWKTNIDLTGRWTGSMKLPVVPDDFRPEWSPAFTLLNIQITQKISLEVEVYASLKNILNVRPHNPILHPDDPFDKPGGLYWQTDGTPNPSTNPNGYMFDPTYNYAPMQGIKLLFGARVTIN